MPSLQRSVETPQSIYNTDWTATGTAGRLRSGDAATVHQDLRYRYSSRGGAFTVVLEIDEDDLVIDYEGIWRRVDS